jgi:hypothetical protein
MKTSIFVVNDVEDVNESGLRTAGGHRASGLQDVEDELIQDIDEQKMSSEKLLALRFIAFLGNRRLSLIDVKLLPIEEQQRLKREFLENN